MNAMMRRLIQSNGALRLLAANVVSWDEVTIDGAVFRLHPRNNHTERRAFLTGQFPEVDSIRRMAELVARAPCCVLDIGANCGSFTVALARAAHPGSHLVAVEPNPEMMRRLAQNLALNGLTDRVTCLNVAVGAAPGDVTLNLHNRNLGRSTVLDGMAEGGAITVPMRTLRDILAQVPPDLPRIIKIDVEGHEDAALGTILDPDRPDLWPHALLMEVAHRGQWGRDLLGQIRSLGFRSTFEGDGNALFERLPEREDA